jgi:hypothetical protein
MITPKKNLTDHAVDLASATLQTLPFTGGLAKYLEEYYPSQQKRMIQFLADELLRQGSTVRNISCDIDKLGVMVNEIVFQLARTSSGYKRLAYFNLLLNYSSGKTTEDTQLEYYCHILSELTELQLRILVIARDVMKYAIAENLVTNEERQILQYQIDNNLVLNANLEREISEKKKLQDKSITAEARAVLGKFNIDTALGTTNELSYPAYKGLISKSLIYDLNYLPQRDNPRSIPFVQLIISDLGRDFISWIEDPSGLLCEQSPIV